MSDKDKAGVNATKALDQQPANETAEEAREAEALQDYSSGSKGGQSMQVKVYSPFKDYYDGEASSISAVNATGPFDILPQHHNFISLLQPCDVIVRTVKFGDRKIRISGGLLHVKADQVVLFLDV